MSKKLFLVAMAIVLSAGFSSATNITGVTGNNGVYNINPEHFSGIAGYRKYDNFELSNGHVANLNFVRPNGNDPSVFVNLVGSNGVNINGIVNTTRNGSFYNGHAVFITPGNFVLGSGGVLNVGSLSVGTPNQTTYNNMVNGYGTTGFDYAAKIGRRVSELAQNSQGNAGAADITLAGKIFSRDGIQMAGQYVTLNGGIVNGLNNTQNQVLSTNAQADALFQALVNTNGTIKNARAFKPAASTERILIKSQRNMNALNASGPSITNPGDIYLTSHGGMEINGKYASQKLLRFFNNSSTNEDLLMSNPLNNEKNEFNATEIQILSNGDALRILSQNEVNADKIKVQNKGIGGLMLSGTLNANESIFVENYGAGNGGPNGLAMDGALNSNGALSVKNHAGNLTIDGTLTNSRGDTAIRNKAGLMQINGTVTTNNGNTAIINEGTRFEIGPDAVITHRGSGKMDIVNTGANGLAVVGKINNNGNLRFINEKGILSFGPDNLNSPTTAAKVTNTNGSVKLISRGASSGIVISGVPEAMAEIQNTNGGIYIRHKGTGTQLDTSMGISGVVKNAGNGVIAINNERGNMNIGGSIQSDGNMGIVNRAGSGAMTLTNSANISAKNLNIRNMGSGNMLVNGTITNTGRANIIADRGALTTGATIHNNSGALSNNGGLYIASRRNGTGINVTNAFNVDGRGEVLIRNLNGANGLNYAGKINTTGHQAALVNHKGNMNISGTIKTVDAPIVISSKGNKMTITEAANINSGAEGILYDNATLDPEISQNASIRNMKGRGKLNGQNW